MKKTFFFVFISILLLYSSSNVKGQNITFHPNIVSVQQKITSNIIILPIYCYDVKVENNKIIETIESNIIEESLIKELTTLQREIEKIVEEILKTESEIEKSKNSMKLLESILTSTTKDPKEINQFIEKFNELQNKYLNAKIKLYSLQEEKSKKEELIKILQDKTNQNSLKVKIIKLLTNTGEISYKLEGNWETIYLIDYDKSTFSAKVRFSLPESFKLKVSKITITTVKPTPELLETKLPKLIASVRERFYGIPVYKSMTLAENISEEKDEYGIKEIENYLGLTWELEKETILENGTELILFEKIPSTIVKKYMAIPSKSSYGIVVIGVSNTSDMVLPQGNVEVIISGSLIQAGTLKTQIFPNESFETLGITVKEINVSKKLLEEKTENPKFLGNNKRVIKTFKTTIKNNLPHDINITILDRIPIPNDDRIKITIEKISPSPLERIEDIRKNGNFSLQINLKKGSMFTLDTVYSAEYPANLIYYEYETE